MKLFKRHITPAAPTFEQVLSTYQKALYWHIRRMVISHEDAQDVLQDTFVNIYKSLPSLKDATALKAWVYRIATNESLRHLSRRRETALSTINDSSMLINDLMESEHVDYDNEMAVKFQQALLTLSDHQRLVFNLRYYDEMPYEEMSSVTGCSVDSLKVVYHNAKEKVKSYMTNN